MEGVILSRSRIAMLLEVGTSTLIRMSWECHISTLANLVASPHVKAHSSFAPAAIVRIGKPIQSIHFLSQSELLPLLLNKQ
jgi:hypothetical protein